MRIEILGVDDTEWIINIPDSEYEKQQAFLTDLQSAKPFIYVAGQYGRKTMINKAHIVAVNLGEPGDD